VRSPANQADPIAADRLANPWVPMSVVIAATIMVALDSTIVNVALHQIGTDLHAVGGKGLSDAPFVKRRGLPRVWLTSHL